MKFEFSAGGVVFKKSENKNLILISQHSQHHGWVFPKGIIGDTIEKEGKEETALREVREETGINGKILQALNPVKYWYVLNKEKIKKTVYYFLMGYVSGDITDHDDEMENVEWLEEDRVGVKLTYESDKKVWHEAKKLLAIYS
jgi:8-oxo-dGTP diphosphatase